MHSDAIISIRPNFAEAILSGSKSIELRRRIPPITVGTKLWIYATKPVGAVVGFATITDILRGSPDAIWALGNAEAGIDRAAFDKYFEGTENAIGIRLASIERCQPVSIEEMRTIRPGFHPPQVVVRISDIEAVMLQRIASLPE